MRLRLGRRDLYPLRRAGGAGPGLRPAPFVGAVRAAGPWRPSLRARLGGARHPLALLLRAARRQAGAAPADPRRRRAGRVGGLWLEGSARRDRPRGAQRRRRLVAAPGLTDAKPVAGFNAALPRGGALVPGQGRRVPADPCRGGMDARARPVTARFFGVHMATASLPILA